jgi:alkanesulfonate monooxygenase SsuD/methylene tetrahydromethanopterin reductase-like flavin-dependent oxidoreductase (luciferase family)
MQIFGNTVRFAVYLPPHSISFEEYLDVWRTAEALGFDAAYVTDHLVLGPGSSERESVFEGLTLLAAMAASTSRIRCGVNVIANTFRNPGHVAKIAATLDHISNGRLELGMGSGHIEVEHEQFGIPFYTRGTRLRMLRESVSIVRSLLSNEVTDVEGRYYTFKSAVCDPKPVQEAVPIIIGGIGEELTPRIVAESADIWNVAYQLPPAEYARKAGVLGEICRQAGRDPNDVRRSMIVIANVARTEADAKRMAEKSGFPNQGLTGTPEQVASGLLEYAGLGVSDFLFYLREPSHRDALQLIAEEVAPIVRREGEALLSGFSAS